MKTTRPIRKISKRKAAPSNALSMLAELHAQRIRLAQETHQRLGQTLTALKWEAYRCVDSLEKSSRVDSSLRQSMKQIAGWIDDLGQFSKELVGQLTPNILITLGLEAAIADSVRSLNKRTGATARFESEEKRAQLDLVYSAIVLDIVNDLLRALEKSVITDVALAVSKHEQTLELTFHAAKLRGRFRVSPQLRYRLELLDGRLAQKRQRGSTSVRLRIPLLSFKSAQS
jgi:signal transduction histidine kinase